MSDVASQMYGIPTSGEPCTEERRNILPSAQTKNRVEQAMHEPDSLFVMVLRHLLLPQTRGVALGQVLALHLAMYILEDIQPPPNFGLFILAVW